MRGSALSGHDEGSSALLVTGAASGIGRATAFLLAHEGAAVVVTDIAAEAGKQVAGEIGRNGGKALFIPLDVADEAAWQTGIEKSCTSLQGSMLPSTMRVLLFPSL